ncbi:MAG: amidohydrolase family protein [Actinobacteria bacterium]|nr:amidohydrolase family protein [Actinomycetota bacterium]
MLDVLIRGGTVIDGTGAPGRRADVGVRDGVIVAIDEPGSVTESATTTVDAPDLVVAPGFVDLHTHYDAQLLWDPSASPSPLHGVTTVLGGNCGFTLAPAAPSDVGYLARLMSRVEGIPLAALEAGVSWDWRSFGEYLDRLDGGGVAVNAGFLAGHSTLRRVVMGADAVGEAASDAQIAAMEELLDDCLAAGALGLSTSQAPTHNDGDGSPVPSRAATRDELMRLAACLAEHDGTQLELIIAGCINGFTAEDVDLMASMALAAGRPLNWNVLPVITGGNHDHQLDASTQAAERGATVVALTLPQGTRIRLSFLSGFVLDGLPGWRETFALDVPERLAALTDPHVRRRLAEGARSPDAGLLRNLARWDRFEVCETFSDENRGLDGRTIGEIARERDAEPFDVLCDVVVADGLRTGLSPTMPPESDETWIERARVWTDNRTIVGGSDAGAHLDMMCGASYTTFLIGEAVRDRQLLPLETAVRELTDAPARLYGLTGRGRIAPGYHADVVVFDPTRVRPGRERTRADLPGDASRIVADAEGIEHVFVNGTEIVRAGTFTGATPGVVLRSGRDTATVAPTR